MRIVSRTKEGRKWEKQYKKLISRLYERERFDFNACANFGLEVCVHCENLKKIGETCPECKNEDIP